MYKLAFLLLVTLSACGPDETTTSSVVTNNIVTEINQIAESNNNQEAPTVVKKIILHAYITGCMDAKPKNTRKCMEKAEDYLNKILPDEQDN